MRATSERASASGAAAIPAPVGALRYVPPSTRRHRHATSWKKRKRARGAGREGRVVCHARAPRAELAAALGRAVGRVVGAKFQLISRQGCTDGDTERGWGKLLHEGMRHLHV